VRDPLYLGKKQFFLGEELGKKISEGWGYS